MRKWLCVLILMVVSNSFTASTPPKREFRSAWIATIGSIDWPKTNGTEAQKQELIVLLDNLRDAGINAVIFQIRPECDAFYASTIEPWSVYLTGAQGRAPSPFYDPLAFAVEEAHKRGMELHAWFNPYRAQKSVNSYTQAANHIMKLHPEWILNQGNYRYLDPGLPQVREYVTRVFMDVVRRYDIDAVHFDDYFYPYEGIKSEDDASFAAYSRGFTNRADWRRDNINLFVKMVHDSIQVVKPYVKLGISPFGIRKNSDAGTGGMESYSAIYCDPLAWIQAKTIDYLTPQVYWAFDRTVAPYGKLVPWWASVMKGVHLYVGQGVYNMETATAWPVGQWPASEVCKQVRFNRNTANVGGNVFFSATHVQRNVKGLSDSLKNDLYRFPAISPVMAWKDNTPPNSPLRLRFAQKVKGGPAMLLWDAPQPEASGELAARYVVYRSNYLSIGPADLEQPGNIQIVTGVAEASPRASSVNGTFAYTVTALDRNANESAMSNVITIAPPPQPLLAFPDPGKPDIGDQVVLSWSDTGLASTYQVQVATDSLFSGTLFVNKTGVLDTTLLVKSLAGGVTYYWRVRGQNPAGYSAYSAMRSFASALPVAPVLLYPVNNTMNVPVQITSGWRSSVNATSYHYQLAKSINFEASSIVFESVSLTDTVVVLPKLDLSRIYFWRVRPNSEIGTGVWSVINRFKTATSTDVVLDSQLPYSFSLSQNHPNPFNPITRIEFSLPKEGKVRLVIYDVLGQEVARLIDQRADAGNHSVSFDGRSFASGVYLYRLFFDNQVLTRRMSLVK